MGNPEKPKTLTIYKKGDLLLEHFRVEEVVEGGFGTVYLTHHQNWDVKIAVKAPRLDTFNDPRKLASMAEEAETWTELGLHPNIAYCYFVREIDGIPHTFVEYIDGGNLKDWILTAKTADLRLGLDLAIQFCHGMAFAHSKGLIHRDLKPVNILLSKNATLKITDFGIAKKVRKDETTGKWVVAGKNLAGLTREYASPEQWDHFQAPPEKRDEVDEVEFESDIFSFGLCLWEMICGYRPYSETKVFAAVKREIPNPLKFRRDLPESLVVLLPKIVAFEKAERKKIGGFPVLRDYFKKIYRELFHENSPHSDLENIDLEADGINNRGVSFIELGLPEEGEKCFRLALEKDPTHPEATFNSGLMRWRKGEISDLALVSHLSEIKKQSSRSKIIDSLIGKIHLERGDFESANKPGDYCPVLRAVGGHFNEIYSGAFSADGQFALLGRKDKTLSFFNLASGTCERTFGGKTSWFCSIAFSSDGRVALAGDENPIFHLWDVEAGKSLRSFVGHTAEIKSLAISRDCCFALSGSYDQTLRFWNLKTGLCLTTFEGHASPVFSCALSPDSNLALSGSGEPDFLLWETKTGKCRQTFEGHSASIFSVVFSHDGSLALSGSGDRTIRLWEISSGKCLKVFEGHSHDVKSVALSPDNRFVLSGSNDKTLRLWEVKTGRCLCTIIEGDIVNCVSFFPGVSFSGNGIIGKEIFLRKFFEGLPQEFSFCTPQSFNVISKLVLLAKSAINSAEESLNSGNILEAFAQISKVTNNQAGGKVFFEALDVRNKIGRFGRKIGFRSAWLARTFQTEIEEIRSASFSPCGRFIAVSGNAPAIRILEIESGKVKQSFVGHSLWVSTSVFSNDGSLFLSGGGDKALRLWDVGTGNCLKIMEGHSSPIESISISPDNYFALSGSDLQLWNLKSGKSIRFFGHNSGDVFSVAFSPCGNLIVSGSEDGTLNLWEAGSGKCIRTIHGHSKGISRVSFSKIESVAFSPDGRLILSGSLDQTLRLWETDTGKLLNVFQGHSKGVYSGAFSPDGHFAISGSGDKTLRLWEIKSGKCLRSFEGHSGEVRSVAFSPDGRFALSGSWDKTIKVWELVWDYQFPEFADWSDEAEPYLKNFISRLLTSNNDSLGFEPISWIRSRISRIYKTGQPALSKEILDDLLNRLSHAGFGWLRPEGVRRKLEEKAWESKNISF